MVKELAERSKDYEPPSEVNLAAAGQDFDRALRGILHQVEEYKKTKEFDFWAQLLKQLATISVSFNSVLRAMIAFNEQSIGMTLLLTEKNKANLETVQNLVNSFFGSSSFLNIASLSLDPPNFFSDSFSREILEAYMHDIMAPIAALKLAVETVESADLNDVLEARRLMQDQIQEGLNELLWIMNGFDLENSKLVLQETPISTIWAKLQRFANGRAQKNRLDNLKVKFSFHEEGVRVNGLESRSIAFGEAGFQRLFMNLIQNARRVYGLEQAEDEWLTADLTIMVLLTPDSLVLGIEDFGPGFPVSDYESSEKPLVSTSGKIEYLQYVPKRGVSHYESGEQGTGVALASLVQFIESIGGTFTMGRKVDGSGSYSQIKIPVYETEKS